MDRRLIRSRGIRPGCGNEGDEEGAAGLETRGVVMARTAAVDLARRQLLERKAGRGYNTPGIQEIQDGLFPACDSCGSARC